MKKLIALLLALVMVLTLGACSSGSTDTVDTPVPTPTPAPTPEPEWETGVIRASYLGGVLEYFQRGDEVSVLGAWESYYMVEGESCALLVDADFLRLETEEGFVEEPGYTRSNTKMYTTAYLNGAVLAVLKLNTKVTVLDKKGDWALIRLEDGTEGFVDAAKLSRWYINAYSGGGGGGGGGASPADGTDVNLGAIATDFTEYQVSFLDKRETPLERFELPVKGMILSPETEGIAVMFNRDEEVRVVSVNEAELTESGDVVKPETCTLWVDDLFVTVPRWAVHMEGDSVYTPWSAYGRQGAAFTEIQEWYKLMTITANKRVEVVDELSEIGMYVVEVDGVYGYAALNTLAATRYVAPAGGGGGGGGGGGSTGWTPPVM